MSKALDNIRILDLSRVLAGPFCTQMLGDLGADIIKIEKPGAGDDTRQWGPPFLKDESGNDTTESAYYLSCNRNKKSVAIDVRSTEGQALIHDLLEHCDVLIENFKVGGLEKYGLGYEQLKDKFPGLVYCSISGFGQDGPLAHEPGYDFLAQGMAGLMTCTGEPDGQPMKVGVALSDIMTGMNAAIGILSALHAREKTGKGQRVDVCLTDCTLASLTNIAQFYLTSGENAPRLGNAHSTIVPYQAFETADSHVIIAVGNNDQFKRLCAFLGKPEWAEDERFARNQNRVQNRDILVPLLIETFKQHPTAHWIDGLRGVDVPCGPVNTMEKVFAEPQIKERDMRIEIEHELSGAAVPLVGSPFKMSETPVSYDNPPPYLGQHTDEILQNLLQLDTNQIQDLQNKGVIQTKANIK